MNGKHSASTKASVKQIIDIVSTVSLMPFFKSWHSSGFY
jgi:hypothetical protein